MLDPAPLTPGRHPMTITTGTTFAAGTCTSCGYVNGTTDGTRMTCQGCQTPVQLTYVQGSYNGQIPCDDRCQYAVGPICSCTCGGDNHRAGYIASGQVPVWVRERDAARHAAKIERAKAKADAKVRAAADGCAALVADFPELADLLGERYDGVWGFMGDMRAALRSGTMTPRQVQAAVQAVTRDREYDQVRAQRDAERDAARAAGVRVPEGRMTVAGEIVWARREENQFGPGSSVKIIVKTAGGWRVKGTCPGMLEPERYSADEYADWLGSLPGRHVELTATAKGPSSGDPTLGYYSRPSKAAFVDGGEGR